MTCPPASGVAPVPPGPEPDGTAAVSVRPARPNEVDRTARIHRLALPAGFFARLGTRFLARYHASFAATGRARLLVAERGGEIVGFLAGTIDNDAHYRTVLRRRPVGLLLAGIAALLRRPRLAAEFVRTRLGRYTRAVVRRLGRPRATTAGTTTAGPTTADGPATAGPGEPVAVLTHVAVTDEARGTGAGRALVDAFTAEVRRARVREVRLVTDREGPGPRFYRRLGWRSRGARRAADGSLVEEFARRP